MYYLPREKSIHTDDPADLDNWHLMMEIAGGDLGISALIERLNERAYEIWTNYKTPFEWKYDEGIWNLEFENVAKRLHYAGVRAFASLSKAE